MGGDKALLQWDGRPAWERQVAVLQTAGAAPVAVVRRTDQSELGALCWRDRRIACGPLAGLEIALDRSQGIDRIAVLAVDMPGIDAEWFRWLLARCSGSGGAVAQHAEAYEPLAAIYPTSILAEVGARLDRGELALQPLIRSLAAAGKIAVVPLPPERLAAARSRNFPDSVS